MSQGFPVLVIKHKRSYKLISDRNDELRAEIKAQENTKFDGKDPVGWVLPALSLYRLMVKFKGTGQYTWLWENEEVKTKFTEQARKCAETEKIRLQRLEELDVRNAKMVRYKERLKEAKEFKFDFTPYHKPTINPFAHQKGAALWLWQAGSGILGAQMGLGKTLIYTLAMEIDPTVKKVLIICPNSLKLTLRDEEIHKYFYARAFILNAKRKNPYPAQDCKYFITNFEYFNREDFDPKRKLAEFGIDKPDVVIVDESHRIKEKGSNTFQNILTHLASVPNVRFIMSSGTPIKSASRELFTQLHLVNPYAFPNQTEFDTTYCGMTWEPLIKQWVYNRSQEKAAELNQLIQPYMYRILKEEALDLPEKIFTRIIIELDAEDQKLYNDLERKVANDLFSTEEMDEWNALTQLLRLQQFTAAIKVSYLREIIDRMLEEGEKVVFIDRFKETLKIVKDLYPRQTVLHTGDESPDLRQDAKLRFIDRESGSDLFAGSSATCNAGLTLVVSSKMFLNTMEWTPADCDQLYDRIHRIGQGYVCNYYLPLVKGTVDEQVYYTVESKRHIVERVIDNREHKDQATNAALKDLLGYLKEKYKY
jgi:SNF2 family DNA or RNA helicase